MLNAWITYGKPSSCKHNDGRVTAQSTRVLEQLIRLQIRTLQRKIPESTKLEHSAYVHLKKRGDRLMFAVASR